MKGVQLTHVQPRRGEDAANHKANHAVVGQCQVNGPVTTPDSIDGHDIFAWPAMTIQRGQVKVENGRYLGKAGDGVYLKRKIPAEIINGPCL